MSTSASPTEPKRSSPKPGPLTRLKSIGFKKSSKKPKQEFPPKSWSPSSSAPNASAIPEELSETPPAKDAQTAAAEPKSEDIILIPLPGTAAALPPSPSENAQAESSKPSASSIAHRVQMMLSNMPPFFSGSSKESSNSTPKDAPGSAPPGVGMPTVTDAGLLEILASSSIMNGPAGASVWSILDRLAPTKPSKQADDAKKDKQAEEEEEDSSVMLYAPLIPDNDSKVELADSEVVSVHTGEPASDGVNITSEAPPRPIKAAWWSPLTRRWSAAKEKASTAAKDAREKVQSSVANDQPQIVEVRVWVPSTTKISLRAAWWGFQIYLPPPVMTTLDGLSAQTAKQAAVITTALTWLLNNIPASVLPPQFRGVLSIAKGLVPILGYVGGFIAWSWSTIRGFDKGYGVMLSATWLLPIALIPGAIDPPPPTPTPAPEPATPASGPQPASPSEPQQPPTEDSKGTGAPTIPPTTPPVNGVPTQPSDKTAPPSEPPSMPAGGFRDAH